MSGEGEGGPRASGRVLPLKGSEHAAADALLPFYVNGTLEGDELDRIKEHLGACEQCRREVDWLREVFAACEAIAPIPDTSPLPESVRIPGFAASPTASTGRVARGWRSRVSEGWAATQPWARMLMAAQFAALAVLGTLHFTEARDEAPYRTLGADMRAVPAGDSLAVMFDPATTEGDMRRLLASAGARIVDGPTATAAFVLVVPAGQSPAALEKLRGDRKVLFAEPLGARSER
ncbi:MAG TPA: zf-HC2 domain-containing protein [Casimicrobiaceae bacterium]|nr:zf-HC2 domain-containing protein [Casimicrobiaceae bacterium]